MLITNIDMTGPFIGLDAFGPVHCYGLRFKTGIDCLQVRRVAEAIKGQFDKLDYIKRRTCI